MRHSAILAILGAACCLHAQTPGPTSTAISQYPVPTVTLRFGSPQPTPLGGKNWAILGNSSCAPDGALFTQMIAMPPEKYRWMLDSLTDGTELVHYAASTAPGYKSISDPYKYFASDNAVVTLASAEPLQNQMSENKKPKSVTLALVYDRKGTLQRAVPIPLKITPKSIGMYGSGDLLVVTEDASTNRLHLLVLDHDGDIKNELSLFDFDYAANRKSGKDQPLANLYDQTDLIQILPHGDNLLLVPQATQATVIEVNEQGIVRTTDLQMPHGTLIRALFPGDGPYWTVSTFNDVKIIQGDEIQYVKSSDPGMPPTKVTFSGKPSAIFQNGPFLQFNSFDGSLIRRIDPPSEMHANILCEHNGEFTAVQRNKKTGRLEILTGSVPR